MAEDPWEEIAQPFEDVTKPFASLDVERQPSFAIPLSMLLVGVAMFAAGVIIGWNADLRLLFGLVAVGGVLIGSGFNATITVFVKSYGSIHVPTRIGILILLATVAVIPLVALVSWFNDR